MLSINELISHVEYDIRLLAGSNGMHRMITWAHAVDTADPWLWVEPGDLMMTTGSNLPSDAAGQVEWLELLNSSRVAGVLIEIPEEGLTLTDELLQAADERNLPLLSAARPILFNKIAHLVVESALRSRWERTEMVQRLFSSYTSHLRRGSGRHERMQLLCRILDAEVQIIHSPTDSIVFHIAPGSITDAEEWLKVDLPGGGREVAYLKSASTELISDDEFMWHWSTLVTMELGFETVQLDHARQRGEPILQDLIRGRVEASAIAPLLQQHGMQDNIQLVAMETAETDGGGEHYFSRIHLVPGLRDKPNLMCVLDGVFYLAMQHPVSEELMSLLATKYRITAGLSRPISPSNRYPEAANQALNALIYGRTKSQFAMTFDEYVRQSLGIFDRKTVKQRVEKALGPLIQHDDSNGTELLHTLSTYLQTDRSGKNTAGLLMIHRQTLVYRLRMIQRLTDIDPNSTIGIVTFHEAIESLQQLLPGQNPDASNSVSGPPTQSPS